MKLAFNNNNFKHEKTTKCIYSMLFQCNFDTCVLMISSVFTIWKFFFILHSRFLVDNVRVGICQFLQIRHSFEFICQKSNCFTYRILDRTRPKAFAPSPRANIKKSFQIKKHFNNTFLFRKIKQTIGVSHVFHVS